MWYRWIVESLEHMRGPNCVMDLKGSYARERRIYNDPSGNARTSPAPGQNASERFGAHSARHNTENQGKDKRPDTEEYDIGAGVGAHISGGEGCGVVSGHNRNNGENSEEQDRQGSGCQSRQHVNQA